MGTDFRGPDGASRVCVLFRAMRATTANGTVFFSLWANPCETNTTYFVAVHETLFVESKKKNLRRMRAAGNMACIEAIRNANKILVGMLNVSLILQEPHNSDVSRKTDYSESPFFPAISLSLT